MNAKLNVMDGPPDTFIAGEVPLNGATKPAAQSNQPPVVVNSLKSKFCAKVGNYPGFKCVDITNCTSPILLASDHILNSSNSALV